MEFPDRARTIVNTLWSQHRELAAGDAEAQRELTRMIAEQIAFDLGPRWGVKAAGPGRPQGPSELAYDAPPLYIWRWSDGDGHVTGIIGAPLPDPLLEPLDQTAGQVFLKVDPIDHLGALADTRPQGPPPAALDLKSLLDGLDDVRGRIEHLESISQARLVIDQDLQLLKAQLQQAITDVAQLRHRRYVATKYGITIVSIPEEDVPKPNA